MGLCELLLLLLLIFNFSYIRLFNWCGISKFEVHNRSWKYLRYQEKTILVGLFHSSSKKWLLDKFLDQPDLQKLVEISETKKIIKDNAKNKNNTLRHPNSWDKRW